jgi:hypothetical protein
MILSAQQLFSNAQVVTSDAGSTNVIDLGAPGTVLGAPAALPKDIGKGKPIAILVQLRVAATGTNPTLDVTLQVDNDVAFGSAKTVATAPQVVGGAAGGRVALFWVPEGSDERYMRLFYNTGGTTPQYDIDAGIVMSDQTND